MLIYQAIEEAFTSEEGEKYISYGIRGVYAAHGKSKEFAKISDISLSKERVEQFADDCTRGQLSPIHLMDAIEDFIG